MGGGKYIVAHPALGIDPALFAPDSGDAAQEATISTLVGFAWDKAQNGLRHILEFGALLLEVERWLAARPARERLGRGATVSLKAWLEEHCPQVNYKTAAGYKAAALGLRNAAKLAADRPLLPLMGEKPLSDEEEEKVRAKVMDVVATSSLRLLKEAARAEPPQLGGAREGAGRPAKGPVDPAKDAEKVLTLAIEGLRRVPEASYRFLPPGAARGAIMELEVAIGRLEARLAELGEARP